MVAFRLTQKTMGVGRCSASPLNQTGHQVIQPHHQHHQQQQPRRKIHPLQRGHIDLSPSEQQAQLICHALSPTVRQKQKQNYKYINANLQTQIHKYANTDTHFMIMTINKECIFNCTEGTFCPATYCPSDILSRRHIVPA